MTTTSQTNLSTQYATDGTTTIFPYTFPVTAATEVHGEAVADSDGTVVPLVRDTDFTVDSIATPPAEGGNIVLQTPLPEGNPWPAGYTVRFWREVPLTQDMALPGVGTKMSTTAIAATLDKLMRAVQQVATQVARCVRVSLVHDEVDELTTIGEDDMVLVVEAGELVLAPRSEFKGDEGDVGPTGPAGQAWDSGSGDPSGAPASGVIFYLDTATGTVWEWSGTAWTEAVDLAGEDGAAGAAGAPGGPWLKGSGVPSAGTGSDGDWYLDTASEKVYEKAAGSWSQIADFSATTGTITGSGTSSKLSKFTGAAAIGDSVITETSSAIIIAGTDPGGSPGEDTVRIAEGNIHAYGSLMALSGEIYANKGWICFGVNNTGVPSAPANGGYLYVEAGALKYVGSSGTRTTIAAA